MPPFPHNTPSSGPCRVIQFLGNFLSSPWSDLNSDGSILAVMISTLTQSTSTSISSQMWETEVFGWKIARETQKHQPCSLLHRTVTSSPSIMFAFPTSSQHNTVIPLFICIYFLLCSPWTPHSLSVLRTIHLLSTRVTFNTAMPHSNTTEDCIWAANAQLKCSSLHSLLVTASGN